MKIAAAAANRISEDISPAISLGFMVVAQPLH